MVNLVKWTNYYGYDDELKRFITKNIQDNDVLIFQTSRPHDLSNRYIIDSIRTQCGTGFPCPFSNSQLATIDENIFNCNKIDIEYLHNKKPDNIVMFSFDKFDPGILKSLICDFGTKSEILGISTLQDRNLVEVLHNIAEYKKKGFDESRIRLLMTLENKYHFDIINMAFASFYSNEECKVSEYQVLDHVSELWSKQNPEQM